MSRPKRTIRAAARRGMTLVELLLAMALTAVIGAATASMLTAVAYGTSSSKDMRSIVGRSKAVSARLGATLRSTTMVLDADGDSLVLWMEDADDNGLPNLSELRRVEFDPAADTLAMYEAPDGVADVTYELTDDFLAITAALMGTADLPQELWATRVDAVVFALDDADPQAAALVSHQLTLRAGDMTDTTIAAIALRN